MPPRVTPLPERERRARIFAVTIAAKRAAAAAADRDDKIRKAYAAGATLRAIATAAGLSFTRIHQIVTKEKP